MSARYGSGLSAPGSHRTTGSDIFGRPTPRTGAASARSGGGGSGAGGGDGAGAGAGAAAAAYPPPRDFADVDADPDPLELEHVVGYAGRWRHSVHCHPAKDTQFLMCLGANVAIGDVTDPHQQAFLRAHDGEVAALAVSTSGALLASGQVGSTVSPSQEAPVVVWEYATRKQLFNLFGIRGQVTHLAFSPDERFLTAAGTDNMLFVWDMETGDQIYGKAQSADIGFLAWGPVRPAGRRNAYTLCYGVGRLVYMSALEYEPRSMRHVLTPTTASMPSGFERQYLAATCDAAGETLLVGTASGELSLFNLSSQRYRASIPVSSNGVLTMASHADLGVLVGSGDGTVKLFAGADTRWQCVADVTLSGRVVGLSVSASAVWLLAGTSAGRIYRVNVGDGRGTSRAMRAEEQEASHVEPLTCVCFDKKRSDVYCTGGLDGRVIVWDLSDYRPLQTSTSPSPVACVWMDDVDGSVVAGCEDGHLRCYKGGTGEEQWAMVAHRGKVNTVVGAAAFFATGGDDARVSVWSRRTREQLIQFVDHVKPVLEVVLDVSSPSMLHSVGADRSVYSFDLKMEKRVVGHQLNRMHAGNFTCVSQRVDHEQEVVTGSTDGEVLFWDCDVLDKPVSRIDLPSRVRINDVAVSPSGQFMVVASDDSVLRLYSLRTHELVSEKVGHSGRVVAARWSPDERQVLTVGTDCCTAVWNFYDAE